MSDFSGRVVLVTGASGGLGSAVCNRFLEAGAAVVGVARSARARDGQQRFTAVPADLTTPQGAHTAVDEALRETGRIDALVHAMGGFAGGRPVAETDDETWDRMMSLNLRPAFLITRAVLPAMIEAGRGRIVAVGSRAGVDPTPTLSAYGVSKAGLNALIQTIAAEVRDDNITANVVLPSVIDTPANRTAMPDADHSKWVSPEAVAEQIFWLCSEQAAEISGALIPVYGRA